MVARLSHFDALWNVQKANYKFCIGTIVLLGVSVSRDLHSNYLLIRAVSQIQ